MPCANPPCTCPSTISGFTTLPTSSTQAYLRIFTIPVSVSTSMAQMWVPCGKEKLCGSKVASASIDGSTPSGQSCRSEEHTSELQSRQYLVCRLLLEKKKKKPSKHYNRITLLR